MAYMILTGIEYRSASGDFMLIELEGPIARMWSCPGPKRYEGPIDGLREYWCDVLDFLRDNGYVKLADARTM